jgi:dTDP-4-dehydrorhamnose 3,5-epimerase
MEIIPLSISDIILLKPKVYEDPRGFFCEIFRQEEFQKIISSKVNFVQENQSKSYQGVLRGLHYQIPPYAQGKLLRTIHGEVKVVAVDLRASSRTFGKYVTEILSGNNKNLIWIPEGFATGILTLSLTSEVIYKATNYYCVESERCILWNDTSLNIDWPENFKILLSHKDLLGSNFEKSQIFVN